MPARQKTRKKTAKSNSRERESEPVAGGIDEESTHANLQQQVQESLETEQLEVSFIVLTYYERLSTTQQPKTSMTLNSCRVPCIPESP